MTTMFLARDVVCEDKGCDPRSCPPRPSKAPSKAKRHAAARGTRAAKGGHPAKGGHAGERPRRPERAIALRARAAHACVPVLCARCARAVCRRHATVGRHPVCPHLVRPACRHPVPDRAVCWRYAYVVRACAASCAPRARVACACCACPCCACPCCGPSCWAGGVLVQCSSRSCGLRSSTSRGASAHSAGTGCAGGAGKHLAHGRVVFRLCPLQGPAARDRRLNFF